MRHEHLCSNQLDSWPLCKCHPNKKHIISNKTYLFQDFFALQESSSLLHYIHKGIRIVKLDSSKSLKGFEATFDIGHFCAHQRPSNLVANNRVKL